MVFTCPSANATLICPMWREALTPLHMGASRASSRPHEVPPRSGLVGREADGLHVPVRERDVDLPHVARSVDAVAHGGISRIQPAARGAAEIGPGRSGSGWSSRARPRTRR